MEEFSDCAAVAAGHFPKELLKFFDLGPRLLLVKGKPKVGKTLFVFGLAEVLGPPINSFIINTREPQPQNYAAFPWLSTNESRDKALDSMPAQEMQPKSESDIARPPEAEAKLKSARDLLKSILGEEPSAPAPAPEKKTPPQVVTGTTGVPELSSLRKAIGNKNPRELMRVYRGLDSMGAARAVVVVNRIDRLGEKYDVPVRPLALALKADLVTGRKAHLVLALEKPTNVIDDISEGIVTLKDVSHCDESLGQLEINKLADSPLKQNRWMFNTMDGKFQILKGISTL